MPLEEQDDSIKKRHEEPDNSSSRLRSESDLALRENMNTSRSPSDTSKVPAISLDESRTTSNKTDTRQVVTRVSDDDASPDSFFAPRKDNGSAKPSPQAELPPNSKGTLKENFNSSPDINTKQDTYSVKNVAEKTQQNSSDSGSAYRSVADTLTRTAAGVGASLVHEINNANARIATETAMAANSPVQSLKSEIKNNIEPSFTSPKQLEKLEANSASIGNMLNSASREVGSALAQKASLAGSVGELVNRSDSMKQEMQHYAQAAKAVEAHNLETRADGLKGDGYAGAKSYENMVKNDAFNSFAAKEALKMENSGGAKTESGLLHGADNTNGILPKIEGAIRNNGEPGAKSPEPAGRSLEAAIKTSGDSIRTTESRLSEQGKQLGEQLSKSPELGAKINSQDLRSNVPENTLKPGAIDNARLSPSDSSIKSNAPEQSNKVSPSDNGSRVNSPETVSRPQTEPGNKVGLEPVHKTTADNIVSKSTADNVAKVSADSSLKGSTIPGAKVEPGTHTEAAKLEAVRVGEQKNQTGAVKDAGTNSTIGKSETAANSIAIKLDPSKGELSTKGDHAAIKLDAGVAVKSAMLNSSEMHSAVQNSISKLDARTLPSTNNDAAKVILQGKVENQTSITGARDNGARDIQTNKSAQAEVSTTRSIAQSNLSAKAEEHIVAGKNQSSQLEGKVNTSNINNIAGTRNAEVAAAGGRAQANIAQGKEISGGNRADLNGRSDATVGQKGSTIGNAAILGGKVAGDAAVGVKGAGRAIRAEGGRYLTGVEIGLLIAAVGIAKARNDARNAKPGEGAAKEFSTHKGFLTERGSRITELTANVRRFPGKEITLSAMLAITGAAGKQSEQANGMANRSMDFNIRIERSIGATGGKTSKEDLVAAALFQQKEADPPAELTDKKKPEEEDSKLDTQLLGLLPSAALLRGRKNEAEETDESDDITAASDSLDLGNTASAYRRVVKIKAEETLVSIAEKEFSDANIAWLIADINFDQTTQHEIDGKRVVEVIKGQDLQLPLESEIAEFYNRRDGFVDPDNLVTIIVENEINRDKLDKDLKDILGLAR